VARNEDNQKSPYRKFCSPTFTPTRPILFCCSWFAQRPWGRQLPPVAPGVGLGEVWQDVNDKQPVDDDQGQEISEHARRLKADARKATPPYGRRKMDSRQLWHQMHRHEDRR
jgi:hypothetical protein